MRTEIVTLQNIGEAMKSGGSGQRAGHGTTTTPSIVVPAKAGTHNHRMVIVGRGVAASADTSRITTTEGMGPHFHEDDSGVFVGENSRIQISNSHAASFPRRGASWAFSLSPPF